MMPPLSTLCPGAFKCAPRLLGVSKEPEASSVQCEASGWPRPRVRWERNGVLLIRNQAREKEELGSLLRTVTSTLPVSLPGLYTCLVGSQHASLSLQTLHAGQLSSPQGASLGTAVGVAVASAAMVLLLVLLLLLFLARRAGEKDLKSTVTGSLQYLRSREQPSPLPPPPWRHSRPSSPLETRVPLSPEASPSLPPLPGSKAPPPGTASSSPALASSLQVPTSPCPGEFPLSSPKAPVAVTPLAGVPGPWTVASALPPSISPACLPPPAPCGHRDAVYQPPWLQYWQQYRRHTSEASKVM